MEGKPKKDTIEVDVTPNYFHLPIDSCELTINCKPIETKKDQYQYTIALTNSIRKEMEQEDDPITCDDNVLQLSQFESIASRSIQEQPGVYDYKVNVTSNDLRSEGYASGKIRIYPGITGH